MPGKAKRRVRLSRGVWVGVAIAGLVVAAAVSLIWAKASRVALGSGTGDFKMCIRDRV